MKAAQPTQLCGFANFNLSACTKHALTAKDLHALSKTLERFHESPGEDEKMVRRFSPDSHTTQLNLENLQEKKRGGMLRVEDEILALIPLE